MVVQSVGASGGFQAFIAFARKQRGQLSYGVLALERPITWRPSCARKTRSKVLPEVPTIAEAGVLGFDVVLWLGIIAPTGMPQPIANRLNATINETIARLEIASEWTRRRNADYYDDAR
jgi:hypothetical protein